MNAKYVVALILALQVSVSLCEIAKPSPELVLKYEGLKATFYKRILKFLEKVQGAAAPMVETVGNMEQAGPVKEFIEVVQTSDRFEHMVRTIVAMRDSVLPLLQMSREAVLNIYEEQFRDQYSDQVDDIINNKIKPFLDTYLPAE